MGSSPFGGTSTSPRLRLFTLEFDESPFHFMANTSLPGEPMFQHFDYVYTLQFKADIWKARHSRHHCMILMTRVPLHVSLYNLHQCTSVLKIRALFENLKFLESLVPWEGGLPRVSLPLGAHSCEGCEPFDSSLQ